MQTWTETGRKSRIIIWRICRPEEKGRIARGGEEAGMRIRDAPFFGVDMGNEAYMQAAIRREGTMFFIT